METVVVAFEGEKNGRRLKELLESSGTAACLLCRTADQVKRLVRQQRLTAVVCGYKFPDGTAEELAGELPGFCTVLLLAPRGLLELVPERPGLLRLPAPAGRRELLAAVEELLRLGEEAGALLPPRRSREEREVVERAKERLMARNGMTEEEAHRALRRRSHGPPHPPGRRGADALGRGASRPLTKGKNWRSMSFDNLIAWTVPPSGAGKRESGANPERSGHCKRGAGRRRHCGDTRRRGPAESRKSGNLLSVQKDRCLPQKAACLFAAVWFDCAHGDEQSRFPPESGIFLSTAQKRRIIMKKLVPLTLALALGLTACGTAGQNPAPAASPTPAGDVQGTETPANTEGFPFTLTTKDGAGGHIYPRAREGHRRQRQRGRPADGPGAGG